MVKKMASRSVYIYMIKSMRLERSRLYRDFFSVFSNSVDSSSRLITEIPTADRMRTCQDDKWVTDMGDVFIK